MKLGQVMWWLGEGDSRGQAGHHGATREIREGELTSFFNNYLVSL